MPLLKQEVKDDVCIVVIDAVQLVDDAVLEQCRRELLELLSISPEKNLLLHFGRVTFMSSSALGMLIRVSKKCKEYNVALKLCAIAPEIRQVFKITGLDKVFDIRDDAAGAMEAFKKSGGLFFRKSRPASYEVT